MASGRRCRSGRQASDRRTRPLRADAGARAGADPSLDADCRRAHRRSDAAERGGAGGARAIRFCRLVVRRARRLLRHFRFLGAQRLREFEFGDAVDVSPDQRLGQPRRLHDAVGVHPGLVRRAGRGVRRQSAGEASAPTRSRCRPGSRPPSSFSFSPPRIRSCALPMRRSRAAISIRSCKIRVSPSIRRCFISAMSASRSRFRSRLRRCSKAASMPPGRAGCGRGCSAPGCASRSASPAARTGPITSSAGAAIGSGIQWKMLR